MSFLCFYGCSHPCWLFNSQFTSLNVYILTIDVLSLGCSTKFLCTLIKWCSQLAKITILPDHPIYLLPSNGLRNWPINDVLVSNLNCWQRFLCQYIHCISYIHCITLPNFMYRICMNRTGHCYFFSPQSFVAPFLLLNTNRFV